MLVTKEYNNIDATYFDFENNKYCHKKCLQMAILSETRLIIPLQGILQTLFMRR